MRELLTLFSLLAITVAHADEWKTVRVPKPIPVNKISKYPDPSVSNKIFEMNLQLSEKGEGFSINTTAEVLKSGKIFSVNDFSTMSDLDEVAAILSNDHCEIHDAFALYKPKMSLKGELQLHVYSTTPVNVVTYGAGAREGVTSITQILMQEYFVVKKPSNKERDLLAMIRCYSFLRSHSSDEAAAKYNAYEAAGAYAPLIKNLGE